MEENEEEPGNFQAHDYAEFEASLSALFDPYSVVRYDDTEEFTPVPEIYPRQIGQTGVKLYLVEQVREGIAAVFDLTLRRKYHENI